METLLEKLNGLNLIQKSIDWMEDLPDELWHKYFKGNYTVLSLDQNIDRHRWYNLADMTFKVGDELINVTYVCDLHSESMTVEDCYHKLIFSN